MNKSSSESSSSSSSSGSSSSGEGLTAAPLPEGTPPPKKRKKKHRGAGRQNPLELWIKPSSKEARAAKGLVADGSHGGPKPEGHAKVEAGVQRDLRAKHGRR